MAAYNQKQMNRQRSSKSRGSNRSSLYRELHGQKFLPTEMPPSFVAQPWNNMTLILRTTGSQIKVSDIRTALQSQAGFTNVPVTTVEKTNVHFDIRLKSYTVWAIDSKPMALLPMDLLNSNCELVRIDSNPQRNMFARAGYKLPLAQSSVTLSTFKQKDIVLLNLLGSANYEIHVNILWKGVDTSLPSLNYTYPLNQKNRLKERLTEMLAAIELSDDDLSFVADES